MASFLRFPVQMHSLLCLHLENRQHLFTNGQKYLLRIARDNLLLVQDRVGTYASISIHHNGRLIICNQVLTIIVSPLAKVSV